MFTPYGINKAVFQSDSNSIVLDLITFQEIKLVLRTLVNQYKFPKQKTLLTLENKKIEPLRVKVRALNRCLKA